MTTQTEQADPLLLDVRAVARELACSTRHILRLVEAGEFPQPVRLGRLIRWPRSAVVDWIAKQAKS